MIERFFRDIAVYRRDGSFASVRDLEGSITALMRYAMLSRPSMFGPPKERRF